MPKLSSICVRRAAHRGLDCAGPSRTCFLSALPDAVKRLLLNSCWLLWGSRPPRTESNQWEHMQSCRCVRLFLLSSSLRGSQRLDETAGDKRELHLFSLSIRPPLNFPLSSDRGGIVLFGVVGGRRMTF